jgi:DNA-binding CsgD family transcriptional regulator
MQSSKPIVLSLLLKKEITELSKVLPSMELSNFAMYIVFNDNSTFALSNLFGIVKAYYHEGLYKHDYTCSPDYLKYSEQGYYLCGENFPGTNYFKDIIEKQYALYPVFTLLREHTECTFIFTAIRNVPCAQPHHFYEKTVQKFQNFCLNFVENMLDTIIKFNPGYQRSFILNDKALRYSVIKQEHEQREALTPRQLECLWLAFQGYSVKEVAKKLGISFYTVEKHFKNIRELFNCESINVAIYKAIQKGLIGKVSWVVKKCADLNHAASFARPKSQRDVPKLNQFL